MYDGISVDQSHSYQNLQHFSNKCPTWINPLKTQNQTHVNQSLKWPLKLVTKMANASVVLKYISINNWILKVIQIFM